MAITDRYFIWINLLIFQLGWFVAILGGNLFAILFILPVMAFHFCYSPCKKDDLLALLLCLVLGVSHDSVLLHFHLLVIPQHSEFPPVWLMVLWILLGLTLNHSLRWIYQRPLIAAILGAVAAPFSYLAGVQLSDADWAGSFSLFIAAISLMWIFLLPLHRFLFLRLKHYV